MSNYEHNRLTIIATNRSGPGWTAVTYEGLTGPRLWVDTFETYEELWSAMADLAGEGQPIAEAFAELDRHEVGRLFWDAPRAVTVEVRAVTLTWLPVSKVYRLDRYTNGARDGWYLFGTRSQLDRAVNGLPLTEWELDALREASLMTYPEDQVPTVTWCADRETGERLTVAALRRAADDGLLTWPAGTL